MTKHNKLKNSGLLFELLVRQFTTDTLNNRDSKAAEILKKYFYNTDLLKEYKIYNTISKTRNLSEVKADVLIGACMEAYKKLNRSALKKKKYELIAEIKQNYNIDEFFKAKVDNYKVLASVCMLLEMNDSDSIDEKVYSDCKYTLLEHVASKKVDDKDEDIKAFSEMNPGTRSLVFALANKKFNDKYKSLNEGQKGILREYINNISTSDNLRKYFNSQIKIIKEQVDTIIDSIKDEVRKVKLFEVSKSLVEIPVNKSVTDLDVNNVLYYYELIKEHNKLNESTK